jgi:hypothetical protein
MRTILDQRGIETAIPSITRLKNAEQFLPLVL